MPQVTVPGFAPPTNGFHFVNYFEFNFSIFVPGIGNVNITKTPYGLCGGIAFATRDIFEAGRIPPPDTDPPAQGTALWNYLVLRLLDSLSIATVSKFGALSNPALPDHETWIEPLGHGRAWRMINEEWPRVRADLQSGHLSPLGLIEKKSLNPIDWCDNHQVLAWGYDLNGTMVTLHIYDSNHPGQDVTLTFDTAHPANTTSVTYSTDETVYMFFRTDYTWKDASSISQPKPVQRDAQFVSQSLPVQLIAGHAYVATLTMRNTGTIQWSPATHFCLGSQNPQDNTRFGTSRAQLTQSVAPGALATFQITISAPASPGTYNFQWQMLQEGVQWFGQKTPNLPIIVQAAPQPNDAAFVSQTIDAQFDPGDTASVTVTMRNTGTHAWVKAAGYQLGSQNPADNTNWGMKRVELPVSQVTPGQQVTFTFDVTAPRRSRLGRRVNFQWQMVQDGGGGWFGAKTKNVAVTVGELVRPAG